jgi:hypothetical protein
VDVDLDHAPLALPGVGDDVQVLAVAGAPKIGEVVLHHAPTRSLVCADLVFNLTEPSGLPSRLAFAITGVGGGRLAQSRVWSWLTTDRAAARASAEAILAREIGRIVPCHGAVWEGDGTSALAAIVTRMTGVPMGRAAVRA